MLGALQRSGGIEALARQAEVERELATAREEAAELRSANVGLRKEMDLLRSRITTIQSEPICPICHSKLDPASRERLTAEYTEEGKALVTETKEISDRLFISSETVRKHVYHIYEKLHVSNRIEAVNKYFPS